MRVTDITIIIIIIWLFTFSWRNDMFWGLTILCWPHFHHHMIASTFALLPWTVVLNKESHKTRIRQPIFQAAAQPMQYTHWLAWWIMQTHGKMQADIDILEYRKALWLNYVILISTFITGGEYVVCKLWKLWIGKNLSSYSYKWL